MGIYKINEGEITIDGEKTYENSKIKERVVCISDDLFFYQSYNIKDTAKLYSGIYPNWSWEMYEEMKSFFRADDRRRCRRMSKGMQKQAAIWLALCARPEVLILDEPVDGLDPVMRKNIWSLIMREVCDRSMTVLVSSHNLRELEDVCDHVGIMHGGELVLEKALDDVKGNIHKLQLAFKDGYPEELAKKLCVLHRSTFGSVETLIIRGDSDEIRKTVSEYSPMVLDILPLTLEEIFIYELGGLGYEF
jgi:ABC-2 type transport system ATP-binding protein